MLEREYRRAKLRSAVNNCGQTAKTAPTGYRWGPFPLSCQGILSVGLTVVGADSVG